MTFEPNALAEARRAAPRSAFARRAGRPAAIALLALGLAVSACKGEGDEAPPPRREEERTVVTLQSYVYATPDDTSFQIAERVRDQIKSAFGALKSLRVIGSNKDVASGGEAQLYKEPLMLVGPEGGEVLVLRVWYRFTDEVTAPSAVQRGVPLLVGGLHRQDDAHFTQILTACTPNTAREREYKGRLQTVFDGSLPGCQEAILGEQAVIDASRVRLDAPDEQVVPEEFKRVYVPVVARLFEQKAAQMGRYPRFEPVLPQSGRAVTAAVVGGRARGAAVEPADGDESAGGEPADDKPAHERPPPAIVVPGAAVDPKVHGPAPDDDGDPNAPPDPQAGVPVVAAAPATPNAGAVVQPRRDEVQSAFDWEDLLDKKFIVMWLAVFALYPLLKRRPTDS